MRLGRIGFGLLVLIPGVLNAASNNSIVSARYYESTGDYERAEQLYRAALEETGSDAAAISLAQLMKKRNATPMAIEFLQGFIEKRQPFSVDARLLLCRYYMDQGLIDPAEDELVRVKKIRPGIRSNLYRELSTEVAFKKGEYNRAIELSSSILRETAGASNVRRFRALSFIELNQPETALSDLRQVIEEQPGDFELHMVVGDTYNKLKKFGEAEKSYLTASRLQGGSPDPLEKLAWLYDAQGNVQKALETLQQALRLSSQPEPLALRFVGFLRKNNLNQKAEEILAAILKGNPKNATAAQQLVEIYQSLGFNDRAAAVLREQVEQFPGRVWAAIAYAKLLREVNQTALAEKVLKRAVSERPDSPEAHIILAISRSEKGDQGDAEDYFKDAVEDFPTHSGAKFNYALFLERQGKVPQAIKMYRGVDPRSNVGKKAIVNLALLLEAQGNDREALAALKQLSATDRQDEAVVAKMRVLEGKNKPADRMPASVSDSNEGESTENKKQ